VPPNILLLVDDLDGPAAVEEDEGVARNVGDEDGGPPPGQGERWRPGGKVRGAMLRLDMGPAGVACGAVDFVAGLPGDARLRP
jgi:hypothetical protein